MALDTQIVPRPAAEKLARPREAASEEFLVFRLHGALYALPALAVREIQSLPELTPLEETAPAIAGVLNLRGQVVPVMDLARRFGHAPRPYRLEDAIIVLEYRGATLAVIVNQVETVSSISQNQLEPPPTLGQTADLRANFVAGLAKIASDVVMLLDLDNLLDWARQTSTDSQISRGENVFAPDATSEERAIFRERAQRLMPSAQTEERGAVFSLALVVLNGEHFGIELDEVNQFGDLRQVSPVPCCPAHIIGQMNLRGDVVTLLDIQPLLQMPLRENLQNAKVVIVQREQSSVGIVLDDVLDVLVIRAENVVAAPSYTAGSKFFSGGVFHEARMICILDFPKILEEEGLIVEEMV